MSDDDRLGGALAKRPLHFFWVLDASGSMAADGKMQALNVAVHEAIDPLRDVARQQSGVELLVRALTFANAVSWVVSEPTPIERFRWSDVSVVPRGVTELGVALRELAAQMRILEANRRGFAPAIVLVSDGQPTDTATPSFRAGLQELLGTAWGERATRLAIGIGRDADLDVLKAFIARGEIEPIMADNPQQLAEALRFVSTLAVKKSSIPAVNVPGGLPPTIGPSTSPIW
ncbi:MAG: vWA domain-containing protein [Egibacteraceae bacterium]